MWSGRAASLGADVEIRNRLGLDRNLAQNFRPCQRRRIGDKRPPEAIQSLRLALRQYLDGAGAVAHPTAHAAALRDAIDERTKADALHAAAEHPFSRCTRRRMISRTRSLARTAGSRGARTPLDHQMRQAPSSDTMHGPMGVRGVHARP